MIRYGIPKPKENTIMKQRRKTRMYSIRSQGDPLAAMTLRGKMLHVQPPDLGLLRVGLAPLIFAKLGAEHLSCVARVPPCPDVPMRAPSRQIYDEFLPRAGIIPPFPFNVSLSPSTFSLREERLQRPLFVYLRKNNA